eukprot:ctg_256.g145
MPSEPELLRATQEAWTRAQRALPAARPLWWWKAAGWPGTEEAQAAADALAAAVEAVLQSAAEETNLSTLRSCLLEAGDMVAALFAAERRRTGAVVHQRIRAAAADVSVGAGGAIVPGVAWRAERDVATDPRLATQRREPAPEQRRQERWTAWASLVDRALTAGAHVQVARHAVRHAVLLRLAELLVLAITEPDVDGGTRSFTARDLSRSASADRGCPDDRLRAAVGGGGRAGGHRPSSRRTAATRPDAAVGAGAWRLRHAAAHLPAAVGGDEPQVAAAECVASAAFGAFSRRAGGHAGGAGRRRSGR